MPPLLVLPLLVPLVPDVPLAPELLLPLELGVPPAQRNDVHGLVQHSSSNVHEPPGLTHAIGTCASVGPASAPPTDAHTPSRQKLP